MGFNATAAALVADVRPLLGDAPTVVELGNQTLRGGAVPDAMVARYHRLARAPTTTEEFYRRLGFVGYTAIDITSKYGSKIMDLNYVLAVVNGYTEEFDLVTNNGTGEHLFDQAAVFENCHNLCKPGGLMLHALPCQGFVNHGLYNFQPKLYVDLARANGYTIERLAIADRSGLVVDLADSARDYAPRRVRAATPGAFEEFQAKCRKRKHDGGVQSVGLLRRPVERYAFRKPIDGRYVDDAETPELRERYAPFGQ